MGAELNWEQGLSEGDQTVMERNEEFVRSAFRGLVRAVIEARMAEKPGAEKRKAAFKLRLQEAHADNSRGAKVS